MGPELGEVGVLDQDTRPVRAIGPVGGVNGDRRGGTGGQGGLLRRFPRRDAENPVCPAFRSVVRADYCEGVRTARVVRCSRSGHREPPRPRPRRRRARPGGRRTSAAPGRERGLRRSAVSPELPVLVDERGAADGLGGHRQPHDDSPGRRQATSSCTRHASGPTAGDARQAVVVAPAHAFELSGPFCANCSARAACQWRATSRRSAASSRCSVGQPVLFLRRSAHQALVLGCDREPRLSSSRRGRPGHQRDPGDADWPSSACSPSAAAGSHSPSVATRGRPPRSPPRSATPRRLTVDLVDARATAAMAAAVARRVSAIHTVVYASGQVLSLDYISRLPASRFREQVGDDVVAFYNLVQPCVDPAPAEQGEPHRRGRDNRRHPCGVARHSSPPRRRRLSPRSSGTHL